MEGACAALQRGDKCIETAVEKSEGKKARYTVGRSAGNTAAGLTARLVTVWTGRSCCGQGLMVRSCEGFLLQG